MFFLTQGFFMKKMQLLAALMLGLCGSMASASADDMSNSMTVSLTQDEATFASQLTDSNKAMFMNMPADMRADCMQLVQGADAAGMKISADEAVQKMASMTGGAATSTGAVQ